MAELNTVLILRNDDTSAWESSEKILKKGELALEYTEDGSVKIKAGNDTDKFVDLDYVGSDVKPAQVFQIELDENDTDDIGAINDYLNNLAETNGEPITLSVGDIAIVKAGIAGNYKSYTSYVYDGNNVRVEVKVYLNDGTNTLVDDYVYLVNGNSISEFSDANTYKVNVTIEDYSYGDVSSFTISKRVIELTNNITQYTYNGEEYSPKVSITNLVNDDVVEPVVEKTVEDEDLSEWLKEHTED